MLQFFGNLNSALSAYLSDWFCHLWDFVTGLVFLILKCRKLVWRDAAAQILRGLAIKTVYWNVGMVLFILLCVGMIIISLL